MEERRNPNKITVVSLNGTGEDGTPGTPGTEIAPGSNIVGENLEGQRLCHAFLLR